MEIKTNQVCEDLIALTWCVKSTMFQLAEAHGLTPPQLFALHTILRGGNTMGRVADTMHCDASNMTGVIDRLVTQKLVVRAESKSDRRTRNLTLTDKGRQLIQEIVDSLPERLGCSKLNSNERQALHATLEVLSKAVS